MLNQCPSCGGDLHYDIASAKLLCSYCESTFDPLSYESNTNAQEGTDPAEMDVTIYTCPACGASISAPQKAAVDYCLFCGSFVTLNQSMSQISRPDYIVPFSKTQEECHSSYKKMIRRKLYAPKQFRDESFLDGFKGIYIPFWTYEYEYGPDITLSGEHESRHGDYIHRQKYEIKAHAENAVKDIAFDASSSFDDQISRNLIPYDMMHRKDFSPSYMFGFFGDTADVSSSVYGADAASIMRDDVWSDLSSDPSLRRGYPKRDSDTVLDQKLNARTHHTLTMLPVWFLTWKKGDRVAYSVVNGDNGRIYSEVPVSIWRYLIISLLTAIPIFLFLNASYTFSASDMLLFSTVLSVLMILMYSTVMQSIVRRQMHADDKGYLSVYQDGKDPDLKENFIISLLHTLSGNFLESLIFIGIIVIAAFSYLMEATTIALVFAIILLPLYNFWCIYRQGKLIGNLKILFDVLGAYAAYIISLAILISDPPADIIYYVTAIVTMAAIAITIIQTTRRYNDLATRPMPHFFDRKAGGNS